MPILAFVARALLLRRLFGGGRSRGRGYPRGWGYGYGPGYGRRAYGRRSRRSSGGFGFWGPFPTYSRRTRGGSSVSVSGCCLPIPLALSVAIGALARLLIRR